MEFLRFFEKFKIGAFAWSYIGHGSYNRVYVSQKEIEIDNYKASWVYKIPIKNDHEKNTLNDCIRAHRKWTELNPQYPSYLSPKENLWFMPYLGKEDASDVEMMSAVIDIYRRTGNIIADGGMISNFVKINEEVVCVDVDLAIRRHSLSSEQFFNEMISSAAFDKFFETLDKQQRPKTLSCIKVLFFLEECLAKHNFDHSLMNNNLLFYLFDFARLGYVITPTIYHNLAILSQNPPEDLNPSWFHPVYLSKLPRCQQLEELTSQLQAIFEGFDETSSCDEESVHSYEVSDENEVQDLLDKMVDFVAKDNIFNHHFFSHLSKRSFFAQTADTTSKLQQVLKLS